MLSDRPPFDGFLLMPHTYLLVATVYFQTSPVDKGANLAARAFTTMHFIQLCTLESDVLPHSLRPDDEPVWLPGKPLRFPVTPSSAYELR